MSELITAARPYARAAFDVAGECNTTSQWSQALEALATLTADPVAQRLIGNPRHSSAQIAECFIEVLGAALDQHGRNFVHLLAANRRLALAHDIAVLFERYRAEAEQSSVAEITSAQPLSDEQQAALCRAIEQRTGRKVAASYRIDEALIGGAVVRIGDFIVDGSIKTKLEKLSQTLAH